jgi:hypothetical protein
MDPTTTPTWLRWLARGREDDPRVAHDLELLAATYGPGAAAPPDRSAAVAHDVQLLLATYGPSGGEAAAAGRPAVGAHLQRYRVLYGLAAAVLAVVVLADPVARPRTGLTEPFGSAGVTDDAPADPAGPTAEALPDLSTEFGDDFALDVVPTEPSPPPSIVSVPPSPPPSGTEVPLRIVASGYASATGGTPLEQPPPEDGLPVGAAAGNTTKMSFVRLSGTATLLRLGLVGAPGANVNETGAAVKLCRINESGVWEAHRGIELANAPTYDPDDCVLANVAADGAWTFDLAGRDDRTSPIGFALVPGVAVSDTFQVTFSPAPH